MLLPSRRTLSPLQPLSLPPPPAMKYSPSSWIAKVAGAIFLCPAVVIEKHIPMMAPFPATVGEIRHRIAIDRMLEECWDNPFEGYEIQPSDEWIVNHQGRSRSRSSSKTTEALGIRDPNAIDGEPSAPSAVRSNPSTYGEITPKGARQLFGAMGLLTHDAENHHHLLPHSQQAHFFDLGSGTGKLVSQVVLELDDVVEKATGIELSPSRHESALRATKSLGIVEQQHHHHHHQQNYHHSDEKLTKLELVEGDLFEQDLSTATHIYVASLCFPQDLMEQLEDRLHTVLSEQQTRGSNGQRLQWVATLKPFPNHLGGMVPYVRFMEMSWTRPLGCAVYLYRCSEFGDRRWGTTSEGKGP